MFAYNGFLISIELLLEEIVHWTETALWIFKKDYWIFCSCENYHFLHRVSNYVSQVCYSIMR